jgi:hypothetical protein
MAERTSHPTPHRGRVTDARGRTVKQLDPVLMHYLRRHDLIPAGPLAEIARDSGSGWAVQGQLIFTTLWSLALVLLVIAHFVKWGGGLSVHPREVRLLIFLSVCFTVNIIIVWYVSRYVRRRQTRRILLGHRRCPHCGYDLKDLPVDPPDGATVCPECGCAWRLPESG